MRSETPIDSVLDSAMAAVATPPGRADEIFLEGPNSRIAEFCTLLRVMRDFLEHGTSYLKPMTMAEVAETVGVHETTVSRAVSGKYMATPQGVFEMKYFFTGGYQTATGESLSNTSVKQAVLDLVKHESGSAPLSDHEIVEILSERGIPIARRTVAKYRSELNILPSHMRRKY